MGISGSTQDFNKGAKFGIGRNMGLIGKGT